MMKCNSCGADLSGTEKFCRACGKAVTMEKPAVSPVPELTLTPPDTLAPETQPVAEAEPVPTTATAVMEKEPPEAPGSAGMPDVPAPEAPVAIPVPPVAVPAAAAPKQEEYSYSYSYNYQRPNAQGTPYRQSAPACAPSNKEDPARVIGMWGYVLSLFLMSLPVAGFVLQIVWACGGTNSLNRRNLARGSLFLWVVRLALAILTLVMFMAVFGRTLPYILDELDYLF